MLKENIENAGPTTFDLVQQLVLLDLTNDAIPKFITSKMYKDYLEDTDVGKKKKLVQEAKQSKCWHFINKLLARKHCSISDPLAIEFERTSETDNSKKTTCAVSSITILAELGFVVVMVKISKYALPLFMIFELFRGWAYFILWLEL